MPRSCCTRLRSIRSVTHGLGAPLSSLDGSQSWGDPSPMNYGSIVDLDESSNEIRGRSPLRGRGRLVALLAVALAADLGMRFAFDRLLGSPPWSFWVLT